MKNNSHSAEWCLLQNQFDSYEKHSLYIKLSSLALFMGALTAQLAHIFVVFMLAVLWLQDAIWKTFQARIETRLLAIESSIACAAESDVMQYNSNYQKTALSGISLIVEYLKQAFRPTVAYPYAILMLGSCLHFVVP